MSLIELFCDVDDFCQHFDNQLNPKRLGSRAGRGRKPTLTTSEIITILIYFHQQRYRDFKTYYNSFVCTHLTSEFPHRVSYNRFVELSATMVIPMCFYLHSRLGQCSGISFIDSTPLPVCHNRRIQRHRVFEGLAGRGKNSMGWFYGFKLHLLVNERGEVLNFCLTPGNTDDRHPVPSMTEDLFGKIFADGGYLSQSLFEQLFERGVQLITPIRKNMKNKLMPLMDKLLLRKRFIIETINDQLKNISQISHSRHRSAKNFVINLLAGLLAYTHQAKKPALNLEKSEREMLPALI